MYFEIRKHRYILKMAGISRQSEGGSIFVPLRKKAKLQKVESNRINPAYENIFTEDRRLELDVEDLRCYNGIEVKGKC